MHTPLIMSAANPLGGGKPSGLPPGTSKPRVPLPKRGSSLNPNRLKTSSGVEFAKGTKAGGEESGRGNTPTGSATNSTAFSKISNP